MAAGAYAAPPTRTAAPHRFTVWSLTLYRSGSAEVIADEASYAAVFSALAREHPEDHPEQAPGDDLGDDAAMIAALVRQLDLQLRRDLDRQDRSPARAAVDVAELGRSPQRRLLDIRLRHAVVLLQTSDLTLAAVAERCGYHSPSHLTRHVKTALDTTPGRLRG